MLGSERMAVTIFAFSLRKTSDLMEKSVLLYCYHTTYIYSDHTHTIKKTHTHHIQCHDVYISAPHNRGVLSGHKGQRWLVAAMNRLKSAISHSTLKELMKQHIGEVTDEWMEASSDHIFTIKLYKDFFVAVGHWTARLNSVAIAQVAESQWKLGKQKARLFGTAKESAFSYVKKAGDKATSGTKFSAEVKELYKAMTGKPLQASVPVKAEASVPVKA